MRRIALLLALALAVTACSDDGDDEASTTTTVADGTEQVVDDGADGGDVPEDAEDEPVSTETTIPDDVPAEDGDAGNPDEGGDPLVFVAELTGDAEVPGPGDTGATGRAEVESSADGTQLCFDMVATGLDSDVAAAHVHEGAAGASGGVVIGIGTPTSSDGDTDTWTDVCVDVERSLVDTMATDPGGFYVNIHTATFGGGAIRGQLATASIFDLTL